MGQVKGDLKIDQRVPLARSIIAPGDHREPGVDR